ncbi:MAG: hypothetical protein C0425_10925, partial [Chlorobiaceae bacterium]|nr:hypothetical protein [Chlorobiaceae bacterium]
NERFRAIFSESALGIAMIDLSGNLVQTNRAFAKMFGYEISDISQLNISAISYQDDFALDWGNYINLIEGKLNHYQVEKRFKRNSGEIFWVRLTVSVLKNALEQPNFTINMFEDITERRKSEEQLRQLSTAVLQSPAQIIITDINSNIIFVNPKFEAISGFTFHEVFGKQLSFSQGSEKTEKEYIALWETVKSGNTWTGELLNKKKDGQLYWVLSSVSPIFNAKGEITNYLAVGEDITERKKMEKELIRQKERAEVMNRLKTNFLANISHELRTPLIGILGYSELIMGEIENPELIEMANSIHKSGNRLLDTVNSVLDLTNFDASRSEYEKKEIRVSEIVLVLQKLFYPSLIEKNLSFKLDFVDENITVFADERALKQILYHLISNAIKFTLSGEVLIRLNSTTIEDRIYAIIEVKDSGIGIAADKINLIFEEFRQVSEGLERSHEGIGLGLSVTKKFIKELGGKIEVSSEVKKGTTFTVYLPAKQYDSEENIFATITTNEPNFIFDEQKPKVLLLEGEKINKNDAQLFTNKKYIVDIASTSEEAIEFANQNDYRIVLIDMSLGQELEGINTLTAMRKIPGYEDKPFIASTSYARVKDKQDFISAGFNYFLPKPFGKNDLLQILDDIFKVE